MISSASKMSFWMTVEDCLVSFHHVERIKAREIVDGSRDRLSSLADDLNKDIIYHEEPFYIANLIAGKEVSLAEHYRAYDALMRKNASASLSLTT